MPSVQFGGLITGLDTNSLIAGLVKAEQGPINILQGQKVKLQAQQSVYGLLLPALGKLKSSAQSLSTPSDFNKRTVESGDKTIVTGSASSTAQTGVSHIVVDALAKTKTIRSSSFTDSNAVVGTGSLTISVGGKQTLVTIDSSNNTLSGVKNAINNAGAAVTASIVNVGPSGSPDYRLVVQSKDTGTANAVTISSTANFFVDGGEVVQAAADAVFSINGLAITRSSNTISDVVTGLTFVLRNEGDRDGVPDGSDPAADISVSTDTATISQNVQQFVDSYNAVNKIINDQFTLNVNTKQQGVLAGDAALRGLGRQLRAELSASGGIGAGLKYISEIGLKFLNDGSLKFDDGAFADTLESDPAGVQNLFILSQNGLGKRVPGLIDRLISTVDGSLTFRQKGIQSDIDRIDGKVARENERIAAFQDRLNRQFNSLEKLVGQLKTQGDFLTQRLAALNRL